MLNFKSTYQDILRNLFFLIFLFFVENTFSQTTLDLKLDDRSYVTVPAQGSDIRYCSNELVDLEFQVYNLSTTNTLDLTANNLNVTLTFGGANTGTATSLFNSSHFSSGGAPNTIQANNGYATFRWPTDLSFSNAGTTTIAITALPVGVTDISTANNSITFEVVNLPTPSQVNLSSTALSNTDFCEGESVTFTATSTSDIVTYTFYVGGVSVQSSTTNSFTPAPVLSSSVSISVRGVTADSCSTSNTLYMFYNDIDVKGTIGQISTTLCENETPPPFTNVVSASGAGSITYRWQARRFGDSFADLVPSITTAVYTPTSGLTTTTFYRRVAISTSPQNKVCEEFSNVIQITVNEPPISGLQVGAITAPNTVAICGSETVTFTATDGQSWRFYIDGNPAGDRSDNSNFATNTLIDGQVVTVESFTTNTGTGGGCSSFSPGITMSVGVNPNVSLTSTAFASSASSSTFCEGEAITFTATSTSGISTYTFLVGGAPQQIGTSNSFSPAAFSSTVSVAVRVETAGGCTATDTLDLFYNDIDVKGTIGQVSTTLCPNETPPAFTNVVSATATIGTIGYRWQTRTLGTNFIDTAPLVTSAVYTPTSGLTTTTFYRRVAESTVGGKKCEEFSNVIQITVNEAPISGLQVGAITAPNTVAVCGSETITFTATGGQSWRFYIDGNPAGDRSDNSNFATNTLIDGQVVTVESFTTNTGTGGGCSSFSPGITMSVGENPIISLTSTAFASSASSSTFCEGEAITFTATSTSGISTYTFLVGGAPQQIGTSNSFSPAAFSSTVSVSVFVQTAGGCTATDTLDLFYNDIDVKGTIGQVSTTLCENETPPAFTNVVSATATIGTIGYRWQTRTIGTNFIDTAPLVTSAVYTPTSGLTTTTFYRRVAESTVGGKKCEEFSNVIQITVNEPPISGLQVGAITAPNTVAICGSETVTFTATDGQSWRFYIDGNPAGDRSDNSNFSTNTLIDGQVVTVESFTTNTGTGGGCSSFSPGITMSVGVNPNVSLTSTAFASSASSSTFCEGEAITFTATSTSGISTYTFLVGGAPQQIGTSNSFSPAAFSSTVSVAVRVETAGGCTATETLDMFLNEITSSGNIGQASATVCAGEVPPAFTNNASATGVGEITYQWEARTYGTAFANVLASATTQVYTPTAGLTTTTFYRRAVYSTFGGKQCEEYSNVVQILVEESTYYWFTSTRRCRYSTSYSYHLFRGSHYI